MNIVEKYKLILPMMFIISACTEEPSPRRPINRNSLKEQIQKEKEHLLQFSKRQIFLEDSFIERSILDRKIKYIRSQHGFWYAYIKKNRKLSSSTPKHGDEVLLNYQIRDLFGKVLYFFKPYPEGRYVVGKSFVFSGFQGAVELMREGEEVSFIFPSYLAFGLLGDGDKVRGNTPVECIVRLNKLIKK